MTHAIFKEDILKMGFVGLEAGQMTIEQLYTRKIGLYPFRIGEVTSFETAIQNAYVLKVALVHSDMLKEYLVKREVAHVLPAQIIACQLQLSTIGVILKPGI